MCLLGCYVPAEGLLKFCYNVTYLGSVCNKVTSLGSVG